MIIFLSLLNCSNEQGASSNNSRSISQDKDINLLSSEQQKSMNDFADGLDYAQTALQDFKNGLSAKEILKKYEDRNNRLLIFLLKNTKSEGTVELISKILDVTNNIDLSIGMLNDPFYLSLISEDIRNAKNSKDIYLKIINKYKNKSLIDNDHNLSFFNIVLNGHLNDNLKTIILKELFDFTDLNEVYKCWQNIIESDPRSIIIGEQLYSKLLLKLNNIYEDNKNVVGYSFDNLDFTSTLRMAIDIFEKRIENINYIVDGSKKIAFYILLSKNKEFFHIIENKYGDYDAVIEHCRSFFVEINIFAKHITEYWNNYFRSKAILNRPSSKAEEIYLELSNHIYSTIDDVQKSVDSRRILPDLPSFIPKTIAALKDNKLPKMPDEEKFGLASAVRYLERLDKDITEIKNGAYLRENNIVKVSNTLLGYATNTSLRIIHLISELAKNDESISRQNITNLFNHINNSQIINKMLVMTQEKIKSIDDHKSKRILEFFKDVLISKIPNYTETLNKKTRVRGNSLPQVLGSKNEVQNTAAQRSSDTSLINNNTSPKKGLFSFFKKD
jgi:tetratricopeptide (TPR) repeat protein